MSLPLHAEMSERIWYYCFRIICGMIFVFLIFPILDRIAEVRTGLSVFTLLHRHLCRQRSQFIGQCRIAGL